PGRAFSGSAARVLPPFCSAPDVGTRPPRTARRSCAPTRSPSASRPATRWPTRSCCGPGSPSTRTPRTAPADAVPAHPPEQYDLAADEAFRRVVIRGSVLATPEFNHAVHPEIFGLEPDREYFCRFRVGSHLSMVGRTKTTSKPSTTPRELSFVFASCNAWQSGFCTAYEHMANEDLDPVVHLGDYLYESGVQNNSRGIETDERFHTETTTLPRIACSIHRPRATRSCSLRTPVSRGFTRSTTTKSSTTGPA